MRKRIMQCFFLLPGSLFFLWWKLASLVLGRRVAFMGVTQFLALWPGITGVWLRAAFYRLALPATSQDTVIGFLTSISSPEASIGPHVTISMCSDLGWVAVGENSMIGTRVSIPSGRKQHVFDDPATPIRLQGGKMEKITIGRDCMICNAATILADVGDGAVVAAGAVVVRPVEPFAIVAGNPATVVGRRGSGPAVKNNEEEQRP